MKQSRLASALETAGSTATGFVLSLGIQNGVNWYYDLPLQQHQSIVIIGVFTVASLVRGYLWRRGMEKINVRRPLSAAMQAVIAERWRQIDQEGYDAEHDSQHRPRELFEAGAAYLIDAGIPRGPKSIFPWGVEYWNPKDVRRDVVRGLALGLAGLELFDRKTGRSDRAPNAPIDNTPRRPAIASSGDWAVLRAETRHEA